jgi:hypothetical protein
MVTDTVPDPAGYGDPRTGVSVPSVAMLYADTLSDKTFAT